MRRKSNIIMYIYGYVQYIGLYIHRIHLYRPIYKVCKCMCIFIYPSTEKISFRSNKDERI